MSIQDVKRAIIQPLFGSGASVEEQLARLQRYYSQLAQEVVNVHNDLQTGTIVDAGGGNVAFTFTWQTPWPVPVTYRCFASFSWITAYSVVRSVDGLTALFTTGVASPAGGIVLIFGVA